MKIYKYIIIILFKTSMPEYDTRLKRYEEQKISVCGKSNVRNLVQSERNYRYIVLNARNNDLRTAARGRSSRVFFFDGSN